MSGPFSLIFVALLVWLIKRLVDLSSRNPRNAQYPPGPKSKFLVGNMFDFPTYKGAEVYLEWAKQYKSDLLYASALGNKVLILNNLEDADELLDRRASKYSDRPEIPLVDLFGWRANMAFLRYGDSWRYHRKICQQSFRAEAARNYHPLLLKKNLEMLQRLLLDPDHFEDHNKMLSISIPLITMFGYEVETFDDPCIVAAEESISLATELLLPGGSWLNIFPVLRFVPAWFPGATSRKTAAKIRKLSNELKRIPFEFVEKGVADGTAGTSFVSDFLRTKRELGASEEEEDAVRNIAFTVYSAASDTTVSATGSFFYLMAVNPEIQKKAQAEIDSVVGSERLPDFEDRPSLPYIGAIYREVLRLKPPVPLGVPHSLTEDDSYKGYFIPKGTTVVSNILAMAHDGNVYPEPLKFNPERFLDEKGSLNDDKRVLAYGFGRRVCVGKYIASDTLWITIASVLACFNVNKRKDSFGNEICIDDDYYDLGFVQHKSKFRCSFVPRTRLANQLIGKTK